MFRLFLLQLISDGVDGLPGTVAVMIGCEEVLDDSPITFKAETAKV